MKLATFGVDSEGNMIVALPVFVKDHTGETKTLFEIETIKVPIPDHNKAADSYSEVKYSKPYLAINYELLHIASYSGAKDVQTGKTHILL